MSIETAPVLEQSLDVSGLEQGASNIEVTLARPVPSRLVPWQENGIVGMMIPNTEYKIKLEGGTELVVPMTQMRTFTHAVVPRVVAQNVDRAKYPWLFEIKQKLELGERSPYALWLKDNAYSVWEAYGMTWAHFTAEDVIGHYKLPEPTKQEQEG